MAIRRSCPLGSYWIGRRRRRRRRGHRLKCRRGWGQGCRPLRHRRLRHLHRLRRLRRLRRRPYLRRCLHRQNRRSLQTRICVSIRSNGYLTIKLTSDSRFCMRFPFGFDC